MTSPCYDPNKPMRKAIVYQPGELVRVKTKMRFHLGSSEATPVWDRFLIVSPNFTAIVLGTQQISEHEDRIYLFTSLGPGWVSDWSRAGLPSTLVRQRGGE